MTEKTVPRDTLEWMISSLIDTLIDTQGEKVKGKKAAGEKMKGKKAAGEKVKGNKAAGVKKNRIIHTNTKADTNKSHVKAKQYDPVKDL